MSLNQSSVEILYSAASGNVQQGLIRDSGTACKRHPLLEASCRLGLGGAWMSIIVMPEAKQNAGLKFDSMGLIGN